MLLKEAISENEIKYIANMLKEDCHKFIFESNLTPLFRGVRIIKQNLAKYETHKNRTSTYAATILKGDNSFFDETNILMLKDGFKAIRTNSVLCTGSKYFASNFGKLTAIFPIDDYNYTYSIDVRDYNEKAFGTNINPYITINDKTYKNIYHEHENDLKKYANYVWNKYRNTFKTTNLINGIKSGNEILLNCDYYYLVDEKIFSEIREELKK